MDMLAPNYRVIAVDSYGAGKSPQWQGDRAICLHDEVELIKPVIDQLGESFTLIGHSYGAAIALIAAMGYLDRIRELVLYEPTLFALLDAESPQPNDADGIREVVVDAVRALEQRDSDSAARRFIDYWMGPGSWDHMPERTRAAIATSIIDISGWRDALFGEPTPLRAIAELEIPVLYMIGKQSPSSSLGVARLLTRALKRVEVVEFEELGHMGPVTHPAIVNETILRFLEQSRESN